MAKTINDSADLKVFSDITGTIGRTPLVRLNRTASNLECGLYVKLEQFNPGGSVKDRIAFTILDAYEQSGELRPGGTVVEATSGNTGVGLAIACALRGYSAIFVMPDKMSQEKIAMLRAFGARVVITPTAVPPDDPKSYYSVAKKLVVETPGAVLANQYHNPANPQSHYESTGPEILEQTGGEVTDIVCGIGTGGTLTGIAKFFREINHDVQIVGVDPTGSILLDAWQRRGNIDGLEAATYKVEGIGEDFVPSTLDLSLIDEMVRVTDGESFHWTRRLAREEGIFAGGSSGAALAGAMKYASKLGPERLVVVILPDSGSRYLSKVWDDNWMREHGFLDLALDEASVDDIVMIHGREELVMASPSDQIGTVIALMGEHAVSQLPVVNDVNELLGIVREIDLLGCLVSAEEDRSVGDPIEGWIQTEFTKVQKGTGFREVLPHLVAEKVVVVVDEEDHPHGILTTIDALEYITSNKGIALGS